MQCLSRNRLSPRYINIATTRYKHAGAAAQPGPKETEEKEKRKQKPTPVARQER
jgi:hypothetical protein